MSSGIPGILEMGLRMVQVHSTSLMGIRGLVDGGSQVVIVQF